MCVILTHQEIFIRWSLLRDTIQQFKVISILTKRGFEYVVVALEAFMLFLLSLLRPRLGQIFQNMVGIFPEKYSWGCNLRPQLCIQSLYFLIIRIFPQYLIKMFTLVLIFLCVFRNHHCIFFLHNLHRGLIPIFGWFLLFLCHFDLNGNILATTAFFISCILFQHDEVFLTILCLFFDELGKSVHFNFFFFRLVFALFDFSNYAFRTGSRLVIKSLHSSLRTRLSWCVGEHFDTRISLIYHHFFFIFFWTEEVSIHFSLKDRLPILFLLCCRISLLFALLSPIFINFSLLHRSASL